MMNLKKIFVSCFFWLFAQSILAQEAKISALSFDNINLEYKGLEKVKNLVNSSKYDDAAKELLKYYRNRTNVKLLDYNLEDNAKFAGKKVKQYFPLFL